MSSTQLHGLAPLVLSLAWAQETVPQGPTHSVQARTLEAWREFLEPKPEELAFEAIEWRSEFLAAALEAQASRKPILLWAMNGHPLGCT
jgi:hypothetical protein